PGLSGAKEMVRSGALSPGVRGQLGEGASLRVVEVRGPIAARRGAAGPEEVRRGRAAAAQGLRGHEGAGEDPTLGAAGQAAPGRSPRPADRAVHGDEQAGRGQEVAGRAGQVPRPSTAAAREIGEGEIQDSWAERTVAADRAAVSGLPGVAVAKAARRLNGGVRPYVCPLLYGGNPRTAACLLPRLLKGR